MPFVGDFTVAQNTVSTITLTDASTGSDPNITTITISLFKYDGSLLNSITYDWPVGDSSVTLTSVMDTDYGLNIQVEWTSSSPDPDGTYSVTKLYVFYWYNMLFAVGLTGEGQARNPQLVNNNNYLYTKFALYTYIIDAQNAVSLASNIYLAQMSLNRASYLRNNQQSVFT